MAGQHDLDVEAVISLLGLEPHPEGGHYREVYRDSPENSRRGTVTAIYYVLKAGEVSAWHRIDAMEIWHHYAGAPLELTLSADGRRSETHILGTNFATGERPLATVPVGVWQSARSLGEWTLVGCTVAPAFQFEGFEMAPQGWEPTEF